MPPFVVWCTRGHAPATRRAALAAAFGGLAWLAGPERSAAAQTPGTAASAAAPVVPASATNPVGVGAIRGTVYDSLARAPLAGVTVQAVVRENLTAAGTTTTDSAGAFRFDSLPAGTYIVGFLDPLLEALEVEVTPRTFAVTPGAPTTVALAIPGLATMRAALCAAEFPAAPGAARDSTGLLIGVVRDADGHGPVAGSRVVVTWGELVIDQQGMHGERRRLPVAARPSGGYVACDVPTDAPVAASAQAPGRESGVVEISLGAAHFLQRDFVLGDSTATPVADGAPRAGDAELAGTVRDPNGRALRGARVQVWGTGGQTVTGENGDFVLGRLPAGTRTVEVRAIGFAPHRSAVDLARGRPASLRVALERPAQALQRVNVIGKGSRVQRWQDEFLARRKAGWGTFFTATDVERLHPLYTTDMLRQAAGVRLLPRAGSGFGVRLRGGCTPAVVLDGMPIYAGADEVDQLVNPQNLAGIEVYTGLGGIPLQYGGLQANGCGAVLLWTKR